MPQTVAHFKFVITSAGEAVTGGHQTLPRKQCTGWFDELPQLCGAGYVGFTRRCIWAVSQRPSAGFCLFWLSTSALLSLSCSVRSISNAPLSRPNSGPSTPLQTGLNELFSPPAEPLFLMASTPEGGACQSQQEQTWLRILLGSFSSGSVAQRAAGPHCGGQSPNSPF